MIAGSMPSIYKLYSTFYGSLSNSRTTGRVEAPATIGGTPMDSLTLKSKGYSTAHISTGNARRNHFSDDASSQEVIMEERTMHIDAESMASRSSRDKFPYYV